MGPVAVAIENSRTIGEALECAKRYLFVHSPALSLEPIADPLGNPEVIGLRYRLGASSLKASTTASRSSIASCF